MGNQETYQQVDWLKPKGIADETVGYNTKKKNLKAINYFLKYFKSKGNFLQESLKIVDELTDQYLRKDFKLFSQNIIKCAKFVKKSNSFIEFLLFFLDLQIQDFKQSTEAIVNKDLIKRFSDEYICILTDKKKMIELCSNKQKWQELILICYEVVFFVETRYESNVFDGWKQMNPKEHLKKLFQIVSTVIFMKHIIQKVCKDKNIAKGQQWEHVTSLIQKLIQHILQVRGDYIRVKSIETGLVTSIFQCKIYDDYQQKKSTFEQRVRPEEKKSFKESEIMLRQSYKQQTLKLWKQQLLQLNGE